MVALKWDQGQQESSPPELYVGEPELYEGGYGSGAGPTATAARSAASWGGSGLGGSGLGGSGLGGSGLGARTGAVRAPARGTGTTGPSRRDFRVDSAGRRRHQRRWRFAVRRALVVVVIAGLGALAWSVAQKLVAQASPGGGAAVACATAGTCSQTYVATAGDTVWSIAVKFSHGDDPRPLMDRLEAQIDNGVLQPGQQLAVP